MLIVPSPRALAGHVGDQAFYSGWRNLSQDMVDTFASLTGDTHWVHTEPERAKAEGPFGGTIAHGFLTLSFLTSMLHECIDIQGAKRFVNYGLDRVRFTHPVRADSRLRLKLTVRDVGAAAGATRATFGCEMEIEGVATPALRAELVVLAYED